MTRRDCERLVREGVRSYGCSKPEGHDGPCGSRACELPPEGWLCTRSPGHDGPCAATPKRDKRSWFPASAPPITGCRVLAWDGNHVRISGYSERDGFAQPNITHWMPLPERP